MRLIPLFVGAVCSAAAAQHIHLTVDTASGAPGDPAVIRAGYLPTESHITLSPEGRILDNGAIAVFELPTPLAGGGSFAGWLAGDPISLTSDFYFATGRLDGGDFNFEVVAVEPVFIGGAPAEFAHGEVHSGAFEAEAVSSAGDRAGRSYHVGIGGHRHGQVSAMSEAGLYDVSMRVWDSAGRYIDSDIVIARFDSGACPADCDGSGALDFFDFLCFQNAFAAGDPYADCNGDLAHDFFDFLCYQNRFAAGCP